MLLETCRARDSTHPVEGAMQVTRIGTGSADASGGSLAHVERLAESGGQSDAMAHAEILPPRRSRPHAKAHLLCSAGAAQRSGSRSIAAVRRWGIVTERMPNKRTARPCR